jgi:signal transduction histidine kinase
MIHKKQYENVKSNIVQIYLQSLISLFIINLIFWLAKKTLKINDVTEVYSLIDIHKGILISIWLSFSGIIIYTIIRIIGLYYSTIKNKKTYVLGIFTFSSIISLIILRQSIEMFLILTVLIIISLLIDSVLIRLKQFYILHHLIYIIAIAGALSLLINKTIEENKFHQQKYISSFLSKKGDKAIETFWKNLNNELLSDTLVQRLNRQNDAIISDSVIDYFVENYFMENTNGFNYQLTFCNTYDSLLLDNSDEIVHCQNFFNDLKSSVISNPSNNLYLLDNEPDNIYYLGEFELRKNFVIYIELTSYFIPGGLAYAELLVDKKPDTPDLSDYSFAKYYQNILVSKFGDYEFHTSSTIFDKYPLDEFFNLNNYKHYKTKAFNGDVIIVSRPLIKISSKIFSFSFLFLILAVLIVFLTSIVYGSNFNQLFNLNLRARLQMFFMIALSTITLTTAIIILFYTNKNNSEKLHAELNEKAHSVLIELQHKLSTYDSLEDVDSEEVKDLLQKFSVVFFSDINLYDSQGMLLATSRPQIFNEGFLSDLINPMAYEEIMVDNLLFYNCIETIGSLNYYSTYLPLFLTSDRVAGIINLPFFARQTEQKKSFRFLLFTFINLFVILGIIGAIVAVLYSRLLTKPLSVLQSNIANIRIDMKNSKIYWKKDDEIGQLISEYNKMVDKLEASSEMLKRSERELAWRELARQIAHEIKNPLTPMKLNIQYLIRAKAENNDQFEEKFEDISSGLIQQIDTLDRVAEMFTDMAKSNTNNFVAINLIGIIEPLIKLFDKSDNVEFKLLKSGSYENFYTRGTEKNLTQIFNNLIKNSLEAISKKEKGEITINIESSESYLNVKFMDNGGGIPENMKDMVFTPYFTTRTTGTGLGLAIVKSLITGMGGNIKLEKSDENGTVFLIKFLKTKITDNE